MININRESVIMFDLDDTLYCEHDYVRSGFRAVADYLHGIYSELEAEVLYRSMHDEWKQNGRGKIFDYIKDQFSLPITVSQLVQVYRDHVPNITLYPDAERLVRFLRNREISIGIITDGDKNVQWHKIEALGLKKWISCIIVSDEWGRECWKPSAVPYLHARKFFGGAAERFIYIGDNPHKDFVTAKKLGFQTLRIIRATGDHMQVRLSPEYEADRIIYDLDELIDCFRV